LVHGALFTRGLGDLHRTAIFVGGSDVEAGSAVVDAVRQTFFGPFRVSVLMDSNGANTTAAAAVLAAIDGAVKTRGSLDGATVAVLAATGPVGQRVARLLSRLEPSVTVKVGSRQLAKAEAVAAQVAGVTGKKPEAFATGTEGEVARGIEGVDIVVAAGAAGVQLVGRDVWSSSGAEVLIDLNAVPPAGIEGVEPTDRATNREGRLAWGALGVGGMKMKIHKRAIETLFAGNEHVLDADEVLAIGRELRAKG
jgi:hypothetical protein